MRTERYRYSGQTSLAHALEQKCFTKFKLGKFKLFSQLLFINTYTKITGINSKARIDGNSGVMECDTSSLGERFQIFQRKVFWSA